MSPHDLSREAARRRYKELMLLLHPDKRRASAVDLCGGNDTCDGAVARVQEAYERAQRSPHVPQFSTQRSSVGSGSHGGGAASMPRSTPVASATAAPRGPVAGAARQVAAGLRDDSPIGGNPPPPPISERKRLVQAPPPPPVPGLFYNFVRDVTGDVDDAQAKAWQREQAYLQWRASANGSSF
mmetsp:Transcript_41783/g.135178  ORF Transcript_41783/g.135178 Transcript_41783/m.135178 type:complete len:183 (+) Transcript_41783:2566-3114(+)